MTKTRMSERTATVAGVLIVSMFIGCSYERNIEKQRKPGRRSNRMPAGSITSSRTSPLSAPTKGLGSASIRIHSAASRPIGTRSTRSWNSWW